MNRKLDLVIRILQSTNRNDANNNGNTRQERVEFIQLETKEEFDEFENSLVMDAKREQFVSINYMSHMC